MMIVLQRPSNTETLESRASITGNSWRTPLKPRYFYPEISLIFDVEIFDTDFKIEEPYLGLETKIHIKNWFEDFVNQKPKFSTTLFVGALHEFNTDLWLNIWDRKFISYLFLRFKNEKIAILIISNHRTIQYFQI